MKWIHVFEVLFWLGAVHGLSYEWGEGKNNTVTMDEHLQCSNDSACPTWFVCEKGECHCGDGHNYAVVCDEKKHISGALDCHCVTYDEQNDSTYLGACFYNCERLHYDDVNKILKDTVYQKLPNLPRALINDSACTYFNRTGLLCGDCEVGHSPLVLSYNLSCVECPDGHKNWWKFILVAFVPLTFFYFFVVVFNINVTSSRLHGVVWFSQVLSIPAFVRLVVSSLDQYHPKALMAAKIFVSFYSYWNLDILRMVLPDTCLNVTTLQALALDYLVALYPFVLILLSYFIIELYDRKCPCIVAVWKPFHKVLSRIQKSWNVRTSVIDSFSTFFLLSYVKIISVSADILIPTRIYKLGSSKSTIGVYYTPSVEYFGHEHLPYAILALTLLALFVCIPTLTLILYPFQLFQKFLSLFPFNWHFLRAFVDSYQGCYKDGTEPGTIDCRWFSTVMLLLRPLLFIIFGSTKSAMFFVYTIIVLAIYLITLINVQPFKTTASRYPSTDTTFYVLLGLCYITLLGREVEDRENIVFSTITFIVAFSSAFIPIAYIVGLVCYWMASRVKRIKLCAMKVHRNHMGTTH